MPHMLRKRVQRRGKRSCNRHRSRWCEGTDAQESAASFLCFFLERIDQHRSGILLLHDGAVEHCEVLSSACGHKQCLADAEDLLFIHCRKADRLLSAVSVDLAPRPAPQKRAICLAAEEGIQ